MNKINIECDMSTFITTDDYDASMHKEILESLVRGGSDPNDDEIIEICEDRAITEMRGYMNKIYDVDAIFSAEGEKRNQLILMFAIDISLYHIFCIHNPYKISKIREDRYNRAIDWLKMVMKGQVTIDSAPKLSSDIVADNSNWQVKSDEVRPTLL